MGISGRFRTPGGAQHRRHPRLRSAGGLQFQGQVGQRRCREGGWRNGQYSQVLIRKRQPSRMLRNAEIHRGSPLLAAVVGVRRKSLEPQRTEIRLQGRFHVQGAVGTASERRLEDQPEGGRKAYTRGPLLRLPHRRRHQTGRHHCGHPCHIHPAEREFPRIYGRQRQDGRKGIHRAGSGPDCG